MGVKIKRYLEINKYTVIYIVLLLIAITFGSIHAFQFKSDILYDDSFISFNYSNHLASGQGMTYNYGQNVEGYSNFLWVLVLALLKKLFNVNIFIGAYLLGIASIILQVVFSSLIAKNIFKTNSIVSVMPAFIFLSSSAVCYWFLSGGLETSLITTLLLISIFYINKLFDITSNKLAVVTGIIVSLNYLLRTELLFLNLFFLIVMSLILLLNRKKINSLNVFRTNYLLFSFTNIVIIVLYTLFRFINFGFYIMPNSAIAKSGYLTYFIKQNNLSSSSWGFYVFIFEHFIKRGTDYFLSSFNTDLNKYFLFIWLFISLLIITLGFFRKNRRQLLLLCPFIFYIAILYSLGSDWFQPHRYFAIILPIFSIILVCNLDLLIEKKIPKYLCIILLVVLSTAFVNKEPINLNKGISNAFKHIDIKTSEFGDLINFIDFLNNNPTKTNETMLTTLAGQPRYYWKYGTVVDAFGLNNKEIAKNGTPILGGSFGKLMDPDYYFNKYNPDFFVGTDSDIFFFTDTKTSQGFKNYYLLYNKKTFPNGKVFGNKYGDVTILLVKNDYPKLLQLANFMDAELIPYQEYINFPNLNLSVQEQFSHYSNLPIYNDMTILKRDSTVQKNINKSFISLEPAEQVLVSFQNPHDLSNIIYYGSIKVIKGKILVGIKPKDGHDIWNILVDKNEWNEIPLPPDQIDFSKIQENECYLFFWVPDDSKTLTEITFKNFSGIKIISFKN